METTTGGDVGRRVAVASISQAANEIASRARKLAGKDRTPIVLALPHIPRESDEDHRSGYMFTNGEEWWSSPKTFAEAVMFRKSVTTDLRQAFAVEVISMPPSIDLDSLRQFLSQRVENAREP